MSPLCTPHRNLCGCTGSCRLSHFACPWGPGPWFHEDLFYGDVAFELNLYAILTTYFFETFYQSPCIWYKHISISGFWSWNGCCFCTCIWIAVGLWIVGVVPRMWLLVHDAGRVVSCVLKIVVTRILLVAVLKMYFVPYWWPSGSICTWPKPS